MGLCPLLPFVGLRKPLMIVWSTPGAAVLAVAGAGGRYDMQHAVGGFIVWGALIGLMGVTGWFERVMKRNPTEIASGLLAGVLARCAMEAFVAAHTALLLVLGVLATYLLAKRLFARYAVVATLWAGIAYVIGTGQMQWSVVSLGFTEPVFTMPAFRWDAVVSLALPLFLATMALQNLPGVAAICESGVQRPVSKLITLTGVATLILAAFGALAFNLNAVTAAICMAPQAHPNSQRRYIAAASCGALHVAMGIGGIGYQSVCRLSSRACCRHRRTRAARSHRRRLGERSQRGSAS